MSSGYTRQAAAEIIPSAVVRSSSFNAELNKIRDAFKFSTDGTTGHTHDGSSDEGSYVPLIADVDAHNKVVVDAVNNRVSFYVEVSSSPVEQVRVQDGAIVPVTDNDIDLGTSSVEFKNAYFDGTVRTDILTVDESATIPTLTISTEIDVPTPTDTTHAATKAYVDSFMAVPFTGATLIGGFDSDEEALGTITSGTVTPEVDASGKENFKTLTNNGAFTLAPPSTSSATTIRIRLINGAAAGAITTTGFDKVNDPDGYATDNAKEYWLYIDHDSTRSTLTIAEIV